MVTFGHTITSLSVSIFLNKLREYNPISYKLVKYLMAGSGQRWKKIQLMDGNWMSNKFWSGLCIVLEMRFMKFNEFLYCVYNSIVEMSILSKFFETRHKDNN
jgi:hypothetical protein